VAAFLPDPIAPAGASDALCDRLAEAEAAARNRFRALAGLKELSRLYHANGYLAEAETCYRGLEQLEPREARWPHLRATILAGYGDLPPALELWRKVRQLAPDYLPAWLRSGDGYFKANRFADAADAYNAALRLERDNPYALLGLARLDLEAGRLDQARQRLEQVVTKTNYVLGYDLIVSLYERLGLTQKATAIRAMAKASGAYRDPPDPWLDSLIEDCVDPYRLSLAAGTIARNGDTAGAHRLLERAVAVAPNDVSVRFQLGTLLVQLGRPGEAQEQLERCTVLAPDFADGWAHLTSLLANQGRLQAADRTLAEGLARCPDSPGLHLMLARKLQSAGRTAEAIAEFEQSIRLRPNEADAYVELGNYLISLGREAEGVAQMARGLEAEPGNPVAIGVLAYHAIATGDEAEARAWLARVRNQPRIGSDQVSRLAGAFQKRFGRMP
jgi:predicted Zn-dependent protease